MQMKHELAQKVVRGEKTETRRPVKEGEDLIERNGLKTVLTKAGRIKWQVGREYTLCWGRGKPAYYLVNDTLIAPDKLMLELGYDSDSWHILKIRLLDIYCEDVREISHTSSIAEGFTNPLEFLGVWASFYDSEASYAFSKYTMYPYDYVNKRPTSLYLAYALKFEKVMP